MIFQYFSRSIRFSRTFQESPLYSSTFQACGNPVLPERVVRFELFSQPAELAVSSPCFGRTGTEGRIMSLK